MIKNFKYILIALVLISNLWGQSELHGVWINYEYVRPSGEKDNLNYILNGDVNIEGIYISKKNKQIVETYSITCKNSSCEEFTSATKILVDAWMGDSYVESEGYNSVTGKKADFGSKKTIIESFKEEKIENISNIVIDGLNSNMSKNNILKFY